MTDFVIEHELNDYFTQIATIDEAHIEALSEKLTFLLDQYTQDGADMASIKIELEKLVTDTVEYLLPEEGEEGTEEGTEDDEVS
tara:strand:- start:435 stop:686 length:252 start_codon:yes stop_codon:yes gene_type:complete